MQATQRAVTAALLTSAIAPGAGVKLPPKIIHRTQFDGGRSTPEEYHQRHAFKPGQKCSGCPRRPVATLRVLLPIEELIKVDAEGVGRMIVEAPRELDALCSHLTDGVYIRTTTVYACRSCLPAAERAAARGAPSWAIVEISRGPGTTNLITSG
jgi:hypothetical protein